MDAQAFALVNTVVPKECYVVSSVSSDAHMWNLVFLQLLLEERGAEVHNLGACVPDEVILEECRRVKPDALVISTVNGHGHLDGIRLIRKLRNDPGLATLRVVIGGKLGVRGSDNIHLGTELLANGFDGVFEAGAGLDEFDRFLSAPIRNPLPQLVGTGRESHD